MKNSKALFVFLLSLISLPFSLLAQVNINDQQNILIRYNPDNSFHNYNNLFQVISENNRKNKQSLILEFTVKTNIQVTQYDKKRQKISITINIESAKGDCKISDFEIDKFTFPDEFNLAINFLDDQSNPFLKIKSRLAEKNNSIAFDTIVQAPKKIFYSRPKTEFLYLGQTNPQRQKVLDQISLINKYYQTPAKIKEYIETIKQFDFNKYDLIQLYSIRIEAIRKWVAQQKELDYNNRLNLDKKDPCAYKKNMQQLELQIEYYQKNLNILMRDIDNTQYKTALEALNTGDTSKAIDMLEGAIRVNQKNIKALCLYTELSWKKHRNRNAFQRGIDYIKANDPNDDEKNSLIQVLDEAINYYIQRGKANNSEQKYNEAIIEFTEAEYICNSFTKILPCSKTLFDGMQFAKKGLYGSYLKVVQKAIDGKLWNMAETYVDLSCKYQKENELYVESDKECMTLIDKMYKRFIQSGDKKLKNNKFSEAIEYYNSAATFSKKYGLNNTEEINSRIEKAKKAQSDFSIADHNITQNHDTEDNTKEANTNPIENRRDIEKSQPINESEILAIKKEEYLTLIENGMAYRSLQANKEAFFSFRKAKNLELQYPLEKDGLLIVLLKETGRQYIQDEVYNVTFLVWANKTDSAQKQLNKLYEIQSFCALQDDEICNTNLNRAKHEINQRICRNSAETYNNSISMATNAININRFSTANDYLKIADAIASKNKLCSLDTAKLIMLKNKIAKPIMYEQGINEFRKLAADSLWDQAFYKYQEIELLYATNELIKSNIHLDSLQMMLMSYYNTKNQTNILKSLIKNRQLNQYIFLFAKKLVHENKVKKNQILKQIAVLKANKDYELNPRSSAKENIKALPNYFYGKSIFNIYYQTHFMLLKNRISHVNN